MSWTFTTSGAAIIKAGVNVNSGLTTSGAILAKWSDESEGKIVSETRRNFLSDYTSLSTDLKNILSNISSSLIAMQIASYDSTGYSAREFETILDVQDDIITKGLNELKDFKSKLRSEA